MQQYQCLQVVVLSLDLCAAVCLCRSSSVMASPRTFLLQALSVLLLLLDTTPVRCQDEDDANTTTTQTGPDRAGPEPLDCPAECSCTAEGAVDCAGVDLIEFPAKLSDRTRQLSLQVSRMTHSLQEPRGT